MNIPIEVRPIGQNGAILHMDQPRGSFSYRDGAAPFQLYRVTLGAVVFRMKLRRDSTRQGCLIFVDDFGQEVPPPPNTAVMIEGPFPAPRYGNVYSLLWDESYTISINGVVVMRLRNQRQQAIIRGENVVQFTPAVAPPFVNLPNNAPEVDMDMIVAIEEIPVQQLSSTPAALVATLDGITPAPYQAENISGAGDDHVMGEEDEQ
jgi:hypothetical protein